MDPQSRIPSLILALRGGFLYCPDRKSFQGLADGIDSSARTGRCMPQWGLICCVSERKNGYDMGCLCSPLGLLTYELHDFGPSYC